MTKKKDSEEEGEKMGRVGGDGVEEERVIWEEKEENDVAALSFIYMHLNSSEKVKLTLAKNWSMHIHVVQILQLKIVGSVVCSTVIVTETLHCCSNLNFWRNFRYACQCHHGTITLHDKHGNLISE